MAKERTEEQKQKREQLQAKKEAKRREKEAKENAYLNASPAESAKANNQKVDNNALDNESVIDSTFRGGLIVDNPVAKTNGALMTFSKNSNPVTQFKRGAEAWKEGDEVGAALNFLGITGVANGIKGAAEIGRNGVVTKPNESKVYAPKYAEEKEKAKMANEETTKKEIKPLESNGETMLDNEDKAEKTEFQKLSEDIHNNYGSVYNDDVQKLPTFMRGAYKNGAFGVPGSADAKARMGYFIANHLGTTLANTLGGIGNAAMANAGKAGTYQAESSAWDEMQNTNLQKGLETSWNREQAKLDTDMQSLRSLLGKDIELLNDRKEQNYLIAQGEKLGQKYETLGEREKANVISGMLLKQYQRTGDTRALAGASALVELSKNGGADILEMGIAKVRNWLGI